MLAVSSPVDVEKLAGPDSTSDSGVDTPAPRHAGNDSLGWDWDADPTNPYNWPTSKKVLEIVMISTAAFAASVGTSILSPSVSQLMEEFDVSSTVAILPLTLYVVALGLGPVVGGPLSETIGRHPVYLLSTPLAAIFTVGAGFTHSFVALCILRFLAGFCFSPSLAISTGTINETFTPENRAFASVIFVLNPFLGPGLGPVTGSFVTRRMGWRWTQWTLVFFSIVALLATLPTKETYHPILKRKRAKQLGLPVPESPPLPARLRAFATIALIRPVAMLFTEPIVSLICIYVACEFATLFSFFAAVPYVYRRVYHFTLEQQGLVFLSIVIGCLLGTVVLLLCNVFLYMPQTRRFPPNKVPPEYRLYPAMIASVGMPLGLFWFGWTAREDISWASPAAAIIPFAMGNLCLFVGTIQYLVDTYHGTTIASAGSANSLARYVLAGVFPLFTVQMYQRLGIGGATSLLGGFSLLLMPVPWAFFKYGERIRAMSKYETAH